MTEFTDIQSDFYKVSNATVKSVSLILQRCCKTFVPRS